MHRVILLQRRLRLKRVLVTSASSGRMKRLFHRKSIATIDALEHVLNVANSYLAYSYCIVELTFSLRISNKYGSVTTLKQWPNQTYILCLRRRNFKSCLAQHWTEIFLEIRHQFRTSILLSNWILTNLQTSVWNLGSDAYFEYTSCYFKVVTLFIRNFFRVRPPYLFIRNV
jgi:hypothetical protein